MGQWVGDMARQRWPKFPKHVPSLWHHLQKIPMEIEKRFFSMSTRTVVVNLFCIGTPFRICSKTCTPLPRTKIYYCKRAKFWRLFSWRRYL